MTPTELGATLRAAREEQGWTQTDVARRAGLSVSLISKMELGEPVRDNSVEAVAAVLGYDFEKRRLLIRRGAELRTLVVSEPLAAAISKVEMLPAKDQAALLHHLEVVLSLDPSHRAVLFRQAEIVVEAYGVTKAMAE